MKDLPEYELLSAYLDGELTADERARVEQLLAGDPAARRQLDELRTLSHALHALPAHRIDEDLSARVLRLAERRMLSESPVAATQAAAATATPAEPIAKPSIGQRLKQPRIWFWPAAALAVALLMWLRGPEGEPPADRQVAMAPKAAAPAEIPSIQASRKMAETAPAPAAEAAPADQLPLVIVQCEITREAARQQVIQELLAADWSRQVSANRLAKGGTDLKKDFDTEPLQDRRPVTQSPDGSLIEFSATRDELQALLAKLKVCPDLFVSVSEPTPEGLLAVDQANAVPADGFSLEQETNLQSSRQQPPVAKMRQEAKSPTVTKPQEGQTLNASKLEEREAVRPMPQAQPIAQQQREAPQGKQARRDRATSDQLTYRVRIELRVVADKPMAGQPASPAAAAPPAKAKP